MKSSVIRRYYAFIYFRGRYVTHGDDHSAFGQLYHFHSRKSRDEWVADESGRIREAVTTRDLPQNWKLSEARYVGDDFLGYPERVHGALNR